MTRGGRNLILMGAGAAVFAAATTSVALAIYHNSGDIYLDRSRPGYLPDEEEVTEEGPEEYEFSKNGLVTAEVLNEYLEHLEEEVRAIDAYQEPFEAGVLSDESLGI